MTDFDTYWVTFIAERDTHSFHRRQALLASKMRNRYDPFQDIRSELWDSFVHGEAALRVTAYRVFLIRACLGTLIDVFDHIRSALLFRSHGGWVIDSVSGCTWDQSSDVGVEGVSCGTIAFGPSSGGRSGLASRSSYRELLDSCTAVLLVSLFPPYTSSKGEHSAARAAGAKAANRASEERMMIGKDCRKILV